MAQRRRAKLPNSSQGPASPEVSSQNLTFAISEGGTGRYLIMIDPDEAAGATRALKTGAGITLASLDASAARPHDVDHILQNEGILFLHLGVAVINSAPDQVQAVNATVATTGSLRVIEPERYVYAQPNVDASYLRGYRDAVKHLVDEILGADSATVASKMARTFDESSLSWGLQATGAANSRYSGKGVKIAILDTGIDLNHPDFVGRVKGAKSFIEGVPSAQDGHGHGTHCAGVAAGPRQPSRMPRFGCAPDADLFVGKVLNDVGRGTDASILAGIQWALENSCDIVSMSLSGPVEQGQAHSRIFEQVASRALDRGTLIIAAAGNDSRRPQRTAPVGHPANCPSIAAVAAVDRANSVAWFSNAGSGSNGGQIDVAGPGVDVVSSWMAPVFYKNEDGTSMATPHVAGIAALHAEANPETRGRALLALLSQSARRLSGSAIDVGVGLVQSP